MRALAIIILAISCGCPDINQELRSENDSLKRELVNKTIVINGDYDTIIYILEPIDDDSLDNLIQRYGISTEAN